MLYQTLAETYQEIEKTPKRLEKIDILAKFLSTLQDEDKETLYLLLGNIYPDYDQRKIGIAQQLVIKALSKVTGLSSERITAEWKKIGDLGLVAEKFIKGKKQSTLSSTVLKVEKVLSNLRKLPELEGEGTVDKKMSLINELLSSSSSLEAKYITRTLLEDLRIGIKDSTIRSALAKVFFERTPEIEAKIQELIDKTNDFAKVFEICKKQNIKEFEKVSLEVGKPIKVMLAQKAKTIEEGFEEVGKPCAIEYKYDGFRILIHKKSNQITLFTRRLENVTKQFPEIVEYVGKYVKGENFILDAEAVGYDNKTKKYMPFQQISQRIKRKYDIKEIMNKLPVEINVFDVLFYNGKSLIKEPFEKRSELVRKIVTKERYKIVSAQQIITSDLDEAEKFYEQALADNQEGVMMKNLQAEYNPGSRVGHMLKIKPEERDMDLVITGGEYGTGKRSGWVSSFILSCLDEKTGEYLEIGKVGTGIKELSQEEQGEEKGVSFEELTNLIKTDIVLEKERTIQVKPKIVLAITYQEIQKSPTYSSGFALRFPRVTALRDDRRAEEITTLQEVQEDYDKQGSK